MRKQRTQEARPTHLSVAVVKREDGTIFKYLNQEEINNGADIRLDMEGFTIEDYEPQDK